MGAAGSIQVSFVGYALARNAGASVSYNGPLTVAAPFMARKTPRTTHAATLRMRVVRIFVGNPLHHRCGRPPPLLQVAVYSPHSKRSHRRILRQPSLRATPQTPADRQECCAGLPCAGNVRGEVFIRKRLPGGRTFAKAVKIMIKTPVAIECDEWVKRKPNFLG